MKRTVTADLDLSVSAPARVVLAVAAARRPGLDVDDDLQVSSGTVTEIGGAVDGSRLHVLDLPEGPCQVRYRAEVDGSADADDDDLASRITFSLPSRYCESDKLQGSAADVLGGRSGQDLLAGVRTWVNERTSYVLGSSRPTDGAVDTFLARDGVCRDFAHLTVAMLRALQVPARLVACYAPGLDPMDFHAVAEAWVDGSWYVVDSTGLAPRQSLLRITTGRDAADTAFMTTLSGLADLQQISVSAVVDGTLPTDDQVSPVVMV